MVSPVGPSLCFSCLKLRDRVGGQENVLHDASSSAKYAAVGVSRWRNGSRSMFSLNQSGH